MYKLTRKEQLIQLSKRAKADISNFLVSSIIVDVNGREWKGVNVEYEIPTNGICAERNAISTALTEGMRFGDLKEVHIFAMIKNEINKDLFTMPCGICRQAIYEVSNGKANIFLYNLNNDIRQYTIEELLPSAFTGIKNNGKIKN